MADNKKTRTGQDQENLNLKKTKIKEATSSQSGKSKTQFDGSFEEGQKPSSDSPLTGMLISFSREINGEYWALHQGRNLIGRDSHCNVVLDEKTISTEHAIININRFENDKDLKCILTDLNSANGTKVDDKGLIRPDTGYDISNKSKITIGGYELLLVLIDKEKEGLKLNDSFKKSEAIKSDQDYSSQNYNPKHTRMG